MKAPAVSSSTFEREVLEAANPVLVMFSADRCRPCKDMAPALKEVAQQLEGRVKVVKIDTDREPAVKFDYAVHALPTLILFKDGKPAARHVGALVRSESLRAWIDVEIVRSLANKNAGPEAPSAVQFKLSNGMDVVALRDHRAPVVTHVVVYRVGSADEPKGFSGIARFLEHLMFKSRDTVANGEFSKIISRLGGEVNAYGGRDTTTYVERISNDQLKTVMEMEAARMAHLRLTNGEVETERQVIIEQRRSSVDHTPSARLDQKMNAALYREHPYGAPKIGWVNDINRLSRKDAMRFYKRHYAPNNAVLVVAGDVTPEEVKRLAEETYGAIPANPDVHGRERPQERPQTEARRIVLKDSRAGAATFRRCYAVPSYVTAERGEAEALELLMSILVSSWSHRLYRRLVVETKLATSIGGNYSSQLVASGAFWINVVSANDDLGAIEAEVDTVLAETRENGVSELELARAKKLAIANHIYASGNQEMLARRYGLTLAIGRTVNQLEGWPEAVSKVTNADIARVAAEYLIPARSVTGWLMPE